MEVLLHPFPIHLLPELAALAPPSHLEPSPEDEIVSLGVGWERRRFGAEADLLGLGRMAVVAEGIDEEVEGNTITEAVFGGGAVEGGKGIVNEVRGGKAVEKGAERGAEEVGRGEGVRGEEAPSEGELEVLAEDIDGPGKSGGSVGGAARGGGGGGPVEEIEGPLPVTGVASEGF